MFCRPEGIGPLDMLRTGAVLGHCSVDQVVNLWCHFLGTTQESVI